MSSRVIAGATSDLLAPTAWRKVPATRGPSRTTPAPSGEGQPQLEAARQRGFSEGVSAVRSQAETEVGSTLQRLSAAIAGLIQLRQQVREEAAGELVQLALAIASRILHRELSVDPEAILGLVKAALAKVQSREIHRIRLHPSHESAVRRLLDQLNPGVAIEITPDASLKPGDVFFETAQGQLEASVSTQLREIERGLADRVSI